VILADLSQLTTGALHDLKRQLGPGVQLERVELEIAGRSNRVKVTPKKAPAHVAGRMNKTERRFESEILEPLVRSGELIGYEFEMIRLRLADRVHYTPDFFLRWGARPWEFVEVKGAHIREDAMLKYRMAADKITWASWRMMQWRDSAWRIVHAGPEKAVTR
jgi:hypothetical protein